MRAMYRFNKKKIFNLCLIILFLIIILTLLRISKNQTLPYITAFLSKTEPVEANILVVEGWLPENALESAQKEYVNNGYDYVITTGLPFTIEYFMLSMDGYLIFYPGGEFKDYLSSDDHSIAVDAFSELDGENTAHFNVFINDAFVGDFYADRQKKKYTVSWSGKLSEIDSIMIHFDNDAIGEWGDRNLFVKEIIINHSEIIPHKNNTVYEISVLNNRRFRNNADSYSELARDKLLSMGIDSCRLINVQSKKASFNKTLNSALAFREWIEDSDVEIKGINIVSSGYHARRTWMTYNQLFGKSYEVGIISIPDNEKYPQRKNNKYSTIREILALLYYRMILIFY